MLFSAKEILLISKIIRNCDMPQRYKNKLVKSFDQYFFEDNPLYKRKQFIDIATCVLDDKKTRTHYRHMSCSDLNDLILNKPQLIYIWSYNQNIFCTVNSMPETLATNPNVTYHLTLTLPYDVDLHQCGFNLAIPEELNNVSTLA